MKHIVCFSGGHSSALVALEVTKRFGAESVVLLNHDVPKEDADVKRFKREVASFLGLPVTYANMNGETNVQKIPSQFDISRKKGILSFPNTHEAVCTFYLKTEPFYKYLAANFPDKDVVIYYGFDRNETRRINRRAQVLGAMGYKTDFPLAFWENRSYQSTLDVGISPPLGYSVYKHANCVGCLKAGILHWYVVYCTDIDTYMDAAEMEQEIGFSIHTRMINGVNEPAPLMDLIPIFCELKALGIAATEHQSEDKFARMVTRFGLDQNRIFKPCECLA
jgi:hypothetical protein